MSLSLAEPPAAITAAAPEPFRIRPLDAALGAAVEGFDVRKAPSGDQLWALKSALREHHIVVFRRQAPDDDAFLHFSSYFGTVFAPPRDAPVLGVAGVPRYRTPDIERLRAHLLQLPAQAHQPGRKPPLR